MFHVQLRQFPHLARAFNLDRGELDARILAPWVAGSPVQLNDRGWNPEKARLTIYEGPQLAPEEIGLGRGWAEVTRRGEDVTDRLLTEATAPPAVEQLKDELVARCATGAVELREVVELVGERHPRARASERLALAERAVGELLHDGRVSLQAGEGAPVDRERWPETLVSWTAWTEPGTRLRAGSGEA